MANVFQILPILVLIGLGWGLCRSRLVADAFWVSAERLTYFLFFPSLLFTSAKSIDLGTIPAELIWIPFLVFTSVSLLTLFAAKMTSEDRGVRSAIYLGAIRSNVYIPTGIAATSLGTGAVGLMAMVVAVSIPLINIYSVLVSNRWSTRNRDQTPHPIREILTNPLILACGLGIFFNTLEIELPEAFQLTLDALAQPALTLGLLSVGASLTRKTDSTAAPSFLVIPSLIKLMIVPVLMTVCAVLAEQPTVIVLVLMVFGLSPASPSAYVFAANTGSNAKLVASLITLQTFLALLLMPLALILMA